MSIRFRNTFAEIDLSALTHNYRFLEGLYGKNQSLCPMVKADGYGHGAIEVARTCVELGAKHLGVALIEEGIELRNNGIEKSILVFGDFENEGAQALLKYQLTPVISQWSQIVALRSHLQGDSELKVHLKFNTGMNRLGFDENQIPALQSEFKKDKALKLRGVCTHFASSEDFGGNESRTTEQVSQFLKIKNQFEGVDFHFYNSAAFFTGVKPSLDFARPGISLYGCLPSLPAELKQKFKDALRPVLSLKTYVGFLQNVKKGKSVSYGGTWTAKRDSKIAVLPCGYGDGVPRLLSNRGSVLIQGKRCSIVGIVCMDYIMVDVTELTNIGPEVKLGEEVVMIGKQGNETILVEELAELSGTITYEILTGFRGRLPRVFVK